jgi:hypothetical protein
MDERHPVRDRKRFLHGAVAASDDHDVSVAEEGAVAIGAVTDPSAQQICFTCTPRRRWPVPKAMIGARVAMTSLPCRSRWCSLGCLVRLSSSAQASRTRAPYFSACFRRSTIISGPRTAFWVSRQILHLVRLPQEPRPGGSSHDQRVKIRSRGVDHISQSSRTAAPDGQILDWELHNTGPGFTRPGYG